MEDTDPGVALAELTADLRRLGRLAQPAERDALARELLARAPSVLRAVRVHAARTARISGVRPAEYARMIGTSKSAVDLLLHRPSTAVRTRTRTATIEDQ